MRLDICFCIFGIFFFFGIEEFTDAMIFAFKTVLNFGDEI